MKNNEVEKKRLEAQKKWIIEDENVEKVQNEKKIEIIRNSAINKIKDKFHYQDAVISSNKEKFELEKKEQLDNERHLRAAQYCNFKHEMALRKRDRAMRLDLRKHDVICDFQEMMKKGGSININSLAKKYDIDIESLRLKVQNRYKNQLLGDISKEVNNNYAKNDEIIENNNIINTSENNNNIKTDDINISTVEDNNNINISNAEDNNNIKTDDINISTVEDNNNSFKAITIDNNANPS